MVLIEMNICIRTATIPALTQVVVVDFSVTLVLHVLLTKVFMSMRGVI